MVLGSTGGYGHDWGLKLTKDGRKLVKEPEVAPFFTGPEGPKQLHRLILEYGPLWQVGSVVWLVDRGRGC